MFNIVLIIVISLLLLAFIGKMKQSSMGRIFLFALIVLIISNIFSNFIPFSTVIIEGCVLVIVGCIISGAYNWIFR